MILETGLNMEMDIEESDKDLDNGNTGYGISSSLTALWCFGSYADIGPT